MSEPLARYPYEAPVTAYGNGGFRFADMSHRGSILCLPTGVFAWEPADPRALTVTDLARALADMKPQSVLLLGTGPTQIFPSAEVTRAFAAAQIGLEPMSTGAAARTYNILLGERRAIGAALIAVA